MKLLLHRLRNRPHRAQVGMPAAEEIPGSHAAASPTRCPSVAGSPRLGASTAARVLECIEGSGRHSFDPCLHLGEDVLDRVEVGTVGRQEQQAGTDCLDNLARFSTLVRRQIIQNDDVFRL